MANLVTAQLLLGSKIIIFDLYSQQPTQGVINTIYYYKDSKISYTWSGTAFVQLSAVATDILFYDTMVTFPATGQSADTLYVLNTYDYLYQWNVSTLQYVFLCQAESLSQQIINNVSVMYSSPAIVPQGLKLKASYIIGFDTLPFVMASDNVKVYMMTATIMEYFMPISGLLWAEVLGNAIILTAPIIPTYSINGGDMTASVYDPGHTGIVSIAQSAKTLNGHSEAYFETLSDNAVTPSIINGNIKLNGVEKTVYSDIAIQQSLSESTTLIAGKIKTSLFTATVNLTTNCVHNFIGYDLNHDTLEVWDTYSGHLCQIGVEYSVNINLISIDLIGWNIQIGESIYFVLYKSVK